MLTPMAPDNKGQRSQLFDSPGWRNPAGVSGLLTPTHGRTYRIVKERWPVRA